MRLIYDKRKKEYFLFDTSLLCLVMEWSLHIHIFSDVSAFASAPRICITGPYTDKYHSKIRVVSSIFAILDYNHD